LAWWLVNSAAPLSLPSIYALWLRSGAGLMQALTLILYSRQGCCLCEGLEQRLRELALHQLQPPATLHVIDIDDQATPANVRAHYDLQVPVLALAAFDQNSSLELQRVSPRLAGEGLFRWLQQACTKALESD